MPGVKEAKAAMAMMPDLTKMQNVVSAMQGVMSSGGVGVRVDAEGDGRLRAHVRRCGVSRLRRGILAPG